MARINVEDSLRTDPRFLDLVIITGCRFKALGMLIDAWHVAQAFFLNESTKKMIPVSEWKKRRCADEVIQSGLALVQDDLIYVSGSREQFAWLEQKAEAGRKGGLRKAENTQNSLAGASSRYENSSESVAGASLSSLSSSLSSLSLNSELPSQDIANPTVVEIATRKKKAPENSESKDACARTWNSYENAYLARYRVKPVRNAKVNGQVKSFVSRIGYENSPDVAEFYLRHNGQRYVANAHPVGLMLIDAEKLNTEWLRGKQITSTEARSMEGKQQIVNAFGKHLGIQK